MLSKGKLLAPLFIVLLLVPAAFYIGKGESDANEVTFPLNITVKTPKGDIEKMCNIYIYRLYSDETRLVKSIEGTGGETTVSLTVEKVDPTYGYPYKSKIRANVNFRILVRGLEGRQALHLSIDPAEIEVTGKKDVVLVEKSYPNGEILEASALDGIGVLYGGVGEKVQEGYKWEWTPVVTYHSWDGLSTAFKALAGSKMAVAAKQRESTREGHPPNEEWGPVEIVQNWTECGEDVVTVEMPWRDPAAPNYHTGQKRYEIFMELQYKYERWREWMAAYWLFTEYIYVVDHQAPDSDPQGWRKLPEEDGDPLPGNGVSDPWNHGPFKRGSQNSGPLEIPIHGHSGETWEWKWRVSVGFSVPIEWPPTFGVSVSLAVWKELHVEDPGPMYVELMIGTCPGHPDYMGYAYTDGNAWMKIFLTWAPP